MQGITLRCLKHLSEPTLQVCSGHILPEPSESAKQKKGDKKQRMTCLGHNFGNCFQMFPSYWCLCFKKHHCQFFLQSLKSVQSLMCFVTKQFVSEFPQSCTQARGRLSQQVQPLDPVVPIDSHVLHVILFQSLVPSLNSKQADKGSKTSQEALIRFAAMDSKTSSLCVFKN